MSNKTGALTAGAVATGLLCVLVGGAAWAAAALQDRFFGVTYISAPMLALLVGMTARNFFPILDREDLRSGASFCARTVLEIALALLGGTVSLRVFAGLGLKALPLLIANTCLAFAVAKIGSYFMGVSENSAVLAGCGIGTCGCAGAAGMSRSVKARESELAFTLTALFLLDLLTAAFLPRISLELGLSGNQFALVSGASITAMDAVEKAQRSFGGLIGSSGYDTAAQIKAVGTVLMAAAIPGWMLCKSKLPKKSRSRRRHRTEQKVTLPFFLLPFLGLLILNTTGLLGDALPAVLKALSSLLLSVALAGVGFKVKLRSLYTRGTQPMALCVIVWVFCFAFCLAFCLLFPGYVG